MLVSHRRPPLHTGIRLKSPGKQPRRNELSGPILREEPVAGDARIEPRIGGNTAGEEHGRPRPHAPEGSADALARDALYNNFSGAPHTGEEEEGRKWDGRGHGVHRQLAERVQEARVEECEREQGEWRIWEAEGGERCG